MGDRFRNPNSEGHAKVVVGGEADPALGMDTDARPRDGWYSCMFRLGQRRHSVFNSDYGMPEGLPHQLSGDQC